MGSRPLTEKAFQSVHAFVDSADLYQEILGGLHGVAELKLAGSSSEFYPEQAVRADILLVGAVEAGAALKVLRGLRSSLELGLTPIILVIPQAPGGLSFPDYDYLITLPLSGFDFKSAIKAVLPIMARLEKYPPLSLALDEKAAREINLLRFMHSRELPQVVPRRDENSPLGYRVSWADALLALPPGQGLLEMNRLAAEGFLLPEVENLVNLCPTCEDFRITLREVCRHCQSPRIRRTPTIQHYSCGHTAPQTAFVRRDRYVCPKCGKELRHIGVDYAKPGEVALCDACGLASQEPELNCLCIKCGATFPPGQTRQLPIHRFRLSQQAVEAATLGLHTHLSLNEVLHHFLNIYSFAFFQAYLDLEIKRALRYHTSFSLISLGIGNRDEIEAQLGAGGKMALVKELGEIIGSNIRQTDLVTFSPNREILVLLIETDEKRAETIVQRLVKKSRELLSFPLEFQYHIACVPNQGQDLDSIRQLLAPGLGGGDQPPVLPGPGVQPPHPAPPPADP